MFHSGNEFPIQEMKDVLDFTHFECTQDSHGNNFTFFITGGQKRVNQILQVFQEFNQDYPSKAIQLEGGLGLDPPIVTFSIHNNYKQHHVYLKIKSAEAAKQAGQDVPYKIWTPAIQKQLDSKEAHARSEADYRVQEAVMEEDPSAFNLGDEEIVETCALDNDQTVIYGDLLTDASFRAKTKLRRQLETDMVPSSFNPVCPKQLRATRTKNPRNVQHEGNNLI